MITVKNLNKTFRNLGGELHVLKGINQTIEKGEKVKVRKHTFREAMYFFPIPYKETVKSDDLLQNPYYE